MHRRVGEGFTSLQIAIKELTMTNGNHRNLNRRKRNVLESSIDRLQEHMTRTIDNEKTQVCCKYNDLTSIIQMNKGGCNPTHMSNIRLLTAPNVDKVGIDKVRIDEVGG